MFANKLVEKIPDPCNAKKHYQPFIIKNNRKSLNQSEIITYQPKTSNNIDIKSVITKHPKTAHKLSMTIGIYYYIFIIIFIFIFIIIYYYYIFI